MLKKGLTVCWRPKWEQVLTATLLRSISSRDLKVQQELLRDSDIRTTMNIYTHPIPMLCESQKAERLQVLMPW